MKEQAGTAVRETAGSRPGWVRPVGTALGVLAGLWAVELALLVLTVMIPRTALAGHLEQAAAHYGQAQDFEQQSDSPLSLVHNYADALLLNIIWNQDGGHPLHSAMEGAYYQGRESQGRGLADTVAGTAANLEYARYWHGSTVVLKPLLCVLTVDGIKTLGAAVLAALAGLCLVQLVRRGLWAAAAALAGGLILVHAWVVPFCFEYYPCFALMFLGTDLVLCRKTPMKRPWLLFLVLGSLVCYFDFLTCEILTLGLPLVVVLLLGGEDQRGALTTAVRCSGAWLGAYGLTWMCKWSLSALVLGRSVADIAWGQGIYRVAGDLAVDFEYGAQSVAAVIVNLSMVQPFRMLQKAQPIAVAFVALVLVLFSLWYLFRREGDKGPALAVFLVGLLPFVRYLCISNHAALHPFMTGRDLLLTVVAVTAAMALSLARPGAGKPGRRRKGTNQCRN